MRVVISILLLCFTAEAQFISTIQRKKRSSAVAPPAAITFGAATTASINGAPGRTGNGDISVTLPTGWTAGQVAIMGVYNDQGDASTPTGWTEITGSPFGTGTVKLCVFTRVMWSGTTAPTTTISGSGTNIAHVAAIATYNNVDTVNIIDVIGTSSTGTGSPMTCGGVTTNYDSSWVVVFAGRGDNEDVNTQTINASATGVTERTDAGTNEGNDAMLDATYFGTMLVQSGRVDGMVSGAAHTTAHTIRPAL